MSDQTSEYNGCGIYAKYIQLEKKIAQCDRLIFVPLLKKGHKLLLVSSGSWREKEKDSESGCL